MHSCIHSLSYIIPQGLFLFAAWKHCLTASCFDDSKFIFAASTSSPVAADSSFNLRTSLARFPSLTMSLLFLWGHTSSFCTALLQVIDVFCRFLNRNCRLTKAFLKYLQLKQGVSSFFVLPRHLTLKTIPNFNSTWHCKLTVMLSVKESARVAMLFFAQIWTHAWFNTVSAFPHRKNSCLCNEFPLNKSLQVENTVVACSKKTWLFLLSLCLWQHSVSKT